MDEELSKPTVEQEAAAKRERRPKSRGQFTDQLRVSIGSILRDGL